MSSSERLVDAAMPIINAMRPREDYDRARRVEAGLDNEGRPIIDNRDFLPLRSPDGSVWRVRISNTGVLSAKREPS